MTNLPKFERPPVVEAVLGVQFKPISGLTNAHLGLIWQKLKPDWPHVGDAPALEPQFEEFGPEQSWRPEGIHLRVSQEVSARLQITNSNEDRMIQLQNGRFLLNWRDSEGGSYPTYNILRPEFDTVFTEFCRILRDELKVGDPQLNQWELTYVNHIPKDTVWNDPLDWAKLFPALPGPYAVSDELRLESVKGEWNYEIEPQKGRLHVQIKHGMHTNPTDNQRKEVLVLVLTTRGPFPNENDEQPSLGSGLDLGHAALVRAFKQMTSEYSHKYWGLQNGSS